MDLQRGEKGPYDGTDRVNSQIPVREFHPLWAKRGRLLNPRSILPVSFEKD